MGDVERLRKLAEAAEPGPWNVCDDEDAKGKFWHVWIGAGMSKRDVAQPFTESDAAYIAAANPTAILELLATLEAANRDRQAAEEALRELRELEAKATPGPWRADFVGVWSMVMAGGFGGSNLAAVYANGAEGEANAAFIAAATEYVRSVLRETTPGGTE
jgi:hypothetical protein